MLLSLGSLSVLNFQRLVPGFLFADVLRKQTATRWPQVNVELAVALLAGRRVEHFDIRSAPAHLQTKWSRLTLPG